MVWRLVRFDLGESLISGMHDVHHKMTASVPHPILPNHIVPTGCCAEAGEKHALLRAKNLPVVFGKVRPGRSYAESRRGGATGSPAATNPTPQKTCTYESKSGILISLRRHRTTLIFH